MCALCYKTVTMANFQNTVAEMTLTDKTAEYSEKVKANEMNPLASLYENLLNLGADSVADKEQKKYIRITNFITINAFIASLVYLTIAILWERWFWFGANLGMTVVCLLVIFMNGFNYTNLSRLTFMLGVNLALFGGIVVMGPQARGDNFFLIALVIPFLIYDLKSTIHILLGVGTSMALLVFCSYLVPFMTAYNLNVEQQLLMYHIGLVIQFFFSAFGCLSNGALQSQSRGRSGFVSRSNVISNNRVKAVQFRPGTICLHHFARFKSPCP